MIDTPERVLVRSLVAALSSTTDAQRRPLAIRFARRAVAPFRDLLPRETAALEDILAVAERTPEQAPALRADADRLVNAAWKRTYRANEFELAEFGLWSAARSVGGVLAPDRGVIDDTIWIAPDSDSDLVDADELDADDDLIDRSAGVARASSSAAAAAGFLAQYLALRARAFRDPQGEAGVARAEAWIAEVAWQLDVIRSAA